MSAAAPGAYVGTELELFGQATTWKRYLFSAVAPWVRGDVLEVGAGNGANVPFLHGAQVGRWHCLEPDPALAAQIRGKRGAALPAGVEVTAGALAALPAGDRYDTILYVDVLEHIEDDRAELKAAAARLRPGGALIVIVPAHRWLFSPFDAAIGHFRRYSRAGLLAVAPPDLGLVRCDYRDSAGLLLSLANRLLLRQAAPTPRQIRFWDRVVVPLSRVLDPLLGHRAGKTVVAIWRR